jgi:methylmalonyl-CoA decarboxylase
MSATEITPSTTDAAEAPAPNPPLIRCELTGPVATIVLANERCRNALSGQLLDELVSALAELARARARVVVLRAAPDVVVWSSGHDIRELPRDGSDPIPYADPLERALRAIRKHPAPVIAMVHGSVWGGATDLALSCDFIVADHTAQFAITSVNLGLPYNASGIQNFIARVGVNIARQMFFTAEPIHAEQARDCGIINYLVDESQLQARTDDLAQRLARKAPLAVSAIKEQIRMLSEANPVSATTFERIEWLRGRVYASSDFQEGINAFLEKRPAKFTGGEPGGPSPAEH